jgi:hypothetical protein
MVTAGDAYDVLVAKLKGKVPDDAWPRLVKALARECGIKVKSKTDKLWTY